MFELLELKDGLLSTPEKELIKARCPDLLPEFARGFFDSREKVVRKGIEIGLDNVTIRTGNKKAVFNKNYFDYVDGLERREYYLSNVPLPGEDVELYPLVVKYKYGVCVLAPVAV